MPPEDDPVFFAINSFGYGGTNAHAILESPPAAAPLESDERQQLVVLPVSARSEPALRALVARYRDSLLDDSHPWQDLCAAVGRRRTHHDYRAAFVGSSRDELIAQIDEWLVVCGCTRSGVSSGTKDGRPGRSSCSAAWARSGGAWASSSTTASRYSQSS